MRSLETRTGSAGETVLVPFRPPYDIKLFFDVRFLINPYYQAELKALAGRSTTVCQFIRDDQAHASFVESLTRLLLPLLRHYHC